MKNILAIGAHPDDMEFICPGTLLKMHKRGYDLYFVIATNGENGFKVSHRPVKDRVKIRVEEQKKSAKLLKVKKIYFLNYRDGFLKNDDSLRKKLVEIIKTVKPEIIFTFDPANLSFENVNLNHRDHRTIGESVFDAVFAAKNRYMYAGSQHRINKFYFFASDRPNHTEDVTVYLEQILKLVKQHRSQYTSFENISEWVKDNHVKASGKYKYSENFRVVEVNAVKI